MPANVKDESIWEKAKEAFQESYGHMPKEDKDYAITMTIYKNMGGKTASILGHLSRLARHFGSNHLSVKVLREYEKLNMD